MPTPSSATSPTSSASSDVPSSRARVTSNLPSKRLDVESIDSLLSSIPPEFLQSKDFNPFSHYDDSVDELNEYHDTIRDAIDIIVDVHHKGFNQATAAFTHVVTTFASTQSTVSSLLNTLNESKRLLTSRSEHLKDYWTQTQTLTHINHTLAKLSYIQQLPTHLSTLTSAKLYLHAVVLLTHTLQMMSEEDLREVEGLLELREEMLERKNTIVEVLMDELALVVYRGKEEKEKETGEKEGDREESSGRRTEISTQEQRRQSGSAAQSSSLVDFTSSRKEAAPSPSPSTSTSSSPTATLSFLSSSPFSPFSPSSSYPIDPSTLLSPDSSIFTDPSFRTLPHLLTSERSTAHLTSPLSSIPRFLSLLVAALDHLNALPQAKTQISRGVRGEVVGIVEREKSAMREKMKEKGRRRGGVGDVKGRLVRVREEEAERLKELLGRIFPQLIQVIRNHVELIHLINLRLQVAVEARGAGKGKGKEKEKERDDPKWSIVSVWETVQIEVQVALQDVLSSSASGQAQGLKLSSREKKGGDEMELTFSFDDSHAPSIARMSRGKEEKSAFEKLQEKRTTKAEPPLVTPTPYNLIVLYRSVLSFTQTVQSIVTPQSKPQPQLMGFLSFFIQSSFLPRLQADVNIEVDSILSDPHAFDPVQSHPSQALHLRCVATINELLSVLLSDVQSLPQSVTDYLALMTSVVERLLTACRDRYQEVTRGVWSAQRLMDGGMRKVMEDEPVYRELIMGEKTADDTTTSLFVESDPLYGPLFGEGFGLRNEQLLTDVRAVEEVCLIGESVEWLADQLYHQVQAMMATIGQSRRRKDRVKKGKKSTPVAVISFRLNQTRISDELTRLEGKRSTDPSLALCRGLLPLSASLLSLSTLTLLTLRFDLHCQLFTALSSILLSSYSLTSPPSEPELFITSLTSSLTSLTSTLNRLTPHSLPYLQRGSLSIASRLGVRMVGRIKGGRVSREGVTQLHVDFFALHQALMGLTEEGGRGAGEEEEFDRCLYYLDLLQLTEDEQQRMLSGEHSSQFTNEELKALTTLTIQRRI